MLLFPAMKPDTSGEKKEHEGVKKEEAGVKKEHWWVIYGLHYVIFFVVGFKLEF